MFELEYLCSFPLVSWNPILRRGRGCLPEEISDSKSGILHHVISISPRNPFPSINPCGEIEGQHLEIFFQNSTVCAGCKGIYPSGLEDIPGAATRLLAESESVQDSQLWCWEEVIEMLRSHQHQWCPDS